MTQVRCAGCGAWYSSELAGCEQCGAERPRPNRALRVARLNAHLFASAEATTKQETDYKRSVGEEFRMAKRLGVEPAPMAPLTKRDLGWA